MVTAAETASGARPEPATAERPSAERSSPPSPRPRRPAPAAAEETESPDVKAADGSLAETGAESTGAEPPQRRALTFFGSVIAQTTVLTALLFYFGMLHADWFFRYFGVNYTVLGRHHPGLPAAQRRRPVRAARRGGRCRAARAWGLRSAQRLVPERVWNRVQDVGRTGRCGAGHGARARCGAGHGQARRVRRDPRLARSLPRGRRVVPGLGVATARAAPSESAVRNLAHVGRGRRVGGVLRAGDRWVVLGSGGLLGRRGRDGERRPGRGRTPDDADRRRAAARRASSCGCRVSSRLGAPATTRRTHTGTTG